jgi:diguanylate cyclase (GGDEF)-like protein
MESPATLLFIDLDKFKPINDTYGHAEGDHALQVFSNILRDVFRESDVVGRMGGDEFAVLLTRSSAKDCESTLHTLRQAVTDCNNRATRGYNLEFSCGFVEYDAQKHQSIEDMLAEADSLMYQQKKDR